MKQRYCIRKGNDTRIGYGLRALVNKESKPLEDLDLKVEVTDRLGKKDVLPHSVKDGKVWLEYPGKFHGALGPLKFTFWASVEGVGQTAIDSIDEVELVPYSYQERPGAGCGNIVIDHEVELDGGVFDFVQGISTYGYWLSVGHEGSVEDFLEWMRKPATDAAREAQEATDGASRVNATLEGTTIHVTDRNGNTTSQDLKGEQGEPGVSGSILYPTMRINSAGHLVGRIPEKSDLGGNLYINSAGHFCMRIPSLN